MTLYNDDIIKIKDIAREIAKEENEAMDKALKAEINRLEAEVKDVASRVIDLEMEMKRAKEVKPKIDQSKKFK